MDGGTDELSTTRLYGGAIGVVSGGYAVFRSTGGGDLPTLLMLLVGAVALVHGVVLFTPVADRLGDASGPLMLGYAAVMLALQPWAAAMAPSGPPGGMGMDGTTRSAMVGADAGMVALALLMLVSGVVMTTGVGTDRT